LPDTAKPDVRSGSILLKKSKMPPQQNSRKSKLIPNSIGDALLKHLRRPLVEFTQVEAVPHVLKRQTHQRFLENWSRRWMGLFQQNRSKADIKPGIFDVRFTPDCVL